MNTLRALAEMQTIRAFFQVLDYTSKVTEAWQNLVVLHGVSGKQTHDAHIIAIMQVHSITDILTFNDKHFKRYAGINVLNPELV